MTLRRTLVLLTPTIAALLLTAGAARAEATGCPGKNLLDALKVSDSAAFARVRASADATKNGTALLWKIETEEESDHPPSYLFGTLHISDERLKKFSPAVEDALNHSSRIATGVEDLSSDRVQEALTVIQETLLPGPTGRLDALLGNPTAERASVMLAHTDLPKAMQPRVKPWVVMALTSQSDCERRRLKEGKLTLDGELERQAEERGVGSFGLETAEMDLSSLAAIPDDAQVSLLKAALVAHDHIDDQTETLVQLYLAHDLAAMWPLEMELAQANGADANALEAYRQSMLEDRNVRMRDRSMMHLASGGVFLAVGAAHLPGDRGLVELLRGIGYKLTPVE